MSGGKHGLVEIRFARRHRELESLAGVAHVGGKCDLPVACRRGVGREPRMRFRDQCLDHRHQRRQALGSCGVHARAHQIVRQVGMQNAVRRQSAGIFWKHDALDADLVRDRRGMEPGGAAESDHGEIPRVEALLEQRQANRRPEIGIGHGEQPLRSGLDGKSERLADRRRNRRPGRGAVEPHVATEETLAIEPAEQHVRVGDRRLGSAPAVGCRTRGVSLRFPAPPATVRPTGRPRSIRRRRRWCGSPPSAGAPACGRSRPA